MLQIYRQRSSNPSSLVHITIVPSDVIRKFAKFTVVCTERIFKGESLCLVMKIMRWAELCSSQKIFIDLVREIGIEFRKYRDLLNSRD